MLTAVTKRFREAARLAGRIDRPKEAVMSRSKAILIAVSITAAVAIALFSTSLAISRAHAQAVPPIEDELILITPVAKTLTDPTLADFVKYAKERWGVTVRASALAAGTPVAYGQILEWKGRPNADIFWGGESALYDKLAEQGLLAKLDLPKAVMDAIPASIGKPKLIFVAPKTAWTSSAWWS
jgi:hypothetical protein